VRTGDVQGARRRALEALDLLPRLGWGVAIGEPLSTLILSATMTGRLGEASELLEIPVPGAMFESRYGLQYLRARGRYHLATGDPELALPDFRRCAELMQAWRMATPAFVPCHADAAEAWLQLNRPDKAAELIDAELERCGPATPRAEGRTLQLLAQISEPRRRPPLLHRATDLLQVAGDRLGVAEAMTGLADAYREIGSYRRAATIAGRARVVAAGIAPAGVDEADGAVPTAGLPEDEDPLASRMLSEAERRVASLAARGYSNREIADQLWITVSTVEQHLTRAFRKLEVRRRVDLPDVLKAIC
jgi:DNA-binding CsgD family transcriptional regulator